MQVRLTIVLLLAAILFLRDITLSAPATIASITVIGNSQISTREILTWISSRPDLAFSEPVLSRDIRTMLEEYRKLGYIHASIDSAVLHYTADSSDVDLVLHLREGRQALVGSVEIAGNAQLTSAEILERFDLGIGEPLDEGLLEADIDALLMRYERLGYPLASCQVSEVKSHWGDEIDSLNVQLILEEGPRVTIDEVRVEGNSETDTDVIVRETRLEKGELFDPVKVDAIRQRLLRLNIFSSVSEPELYLRNKVNGLLIKVLEGRSNSFDGIIGYVPGKESGEHGFFTGLASFTMRNLFGTGRKFSFRWQREDRETQELGVRYLEPWVAGFPVNVGLGFFQRQQDTSYVRRSVDLKGELLVTEEFSTSLLFSSENVIPSAGTGTSRVFNTSTQTVGIELLYDSRDDVFSPTSGARYRTDFQYGKQKTRNIPPELASTVKSNVDVQRFSLDLDFYLSTFTRHVLATGIHGRELRSSQIDEGQMYRFGGTNTLRGYRESQFLGSRVAWTNTEYRFLLARRSFLYGFMDTGYYFRPADDFRAIPASEGFRYGYGVGLQIETSLGHLGVSFALGQGDSFSSGKIHFGLINEF